MANTDMANSSTEHTTTPRPRRRRRIKVVVFSLVGVAALLVGGMYVWLSVTDEVHNLGADDCVEAPLSSHSAATAESPTRAHEEVCEVIEALSDAWAAHDADAYGAEFTVDATYTTFVGTHYTGRDDIVESHRVLFEGPLNGTRLADAFLSVNLLGEDAAVVSTRGDTYDGDRPDELTKLQTYTLAKDAGGEWKIASFHNTKRSPVMERLQFLMEPDSTPSAER